MVEVLGGEVSELDLVVGFLDSNASDVGVQSAVAIDTDVGWLFALDVDGDGLWCQILMVERHRCDTHKSSCVAIQFHDISAVAMSIGSGSDGCAEDKACTVDVIGFCFCLYMKSKVVDEVFSDDDIVDSIAGVCVAIDILHGDMRKFFGYDSVLIECGWEFVVALDAIHQKTDGSEIDSDKGEVVGLVFFDTIEHEAIATCDQDSLCLFWVVGKTLWMTGDIVLERGGVFVGAEEGEEDDGEW